MKPEPRAKARSTPRGVLPQSDGKLSEKSVAIMRMLSKGMSTEQIVAADPAVQRDHIAVAAREALVLNNAARSFQERMERITAASPRAYEKWTRDEEIRLIEMYNFGKTIREIAATLNRPPNAIRNRLDRLGVFG